MVKPGTGRTERVILSCHDLGKYRSPGSFSWTLNICSLETAPSSIIQHVSKANISRKNCVNLKFKSVYDIRRRKNILKKWGECLIRNTLRVYTCCKTDYLNETLNNFFDPFGILEMHGFCSWTDSLKGQYRVASD